MDQTAYQRENRLKLLSTWKTQNKRRSNSRERSTTPENGPQLSKKINTVNNRRLSRGKNALTPIASAEQSAGAGLDSLATIIVTPPLSEKEMPLQVAVKSALFGSPNKVDCEGKENQMEISLPTAMPMEIAAETNVTADPVPPTINNNVIAEEGFEKAEYVVGTTSVVIQQNPQPVIQQEDQSDLPYTSGDVVWAYINGFPLWPSLVSVDPVENIFTKTRMIGKTIGRFYHVQFFGDNGSHSWIAANLLFPFQGGVEELMKDPNFIKHINSKSKVFKSLQQVLKSRRQNWLLAFDEAKGSIQKDKEERYSNLLKTVALKAEGQSQRKRKSNSEEGDESKPKRRRQSKEASNLEESTSTEAELAPIEEEQAPSEASSDQTESVVSVEENHPEEPVVTVQEDLEAKKIEKERKTLEMKVEVCECCGLRDGQLLSCSKCRTVYHAHCLRGETKQPEGEPELMSEAVNVPAFFCLNCDPASEPTCCLCKQPGGQLMKCNQVRICSRRFHQECLKGFHSLSAKKERPASQFTCPAHFCHTCTADVEELQKPDKTKLIHCTQCPTAYHSSEKCLAAGCVLLSITQMKCFKHVESRALKIKKNGSKKERKAQHPIHYNLNWCVMCSEGGSLICCERCPNSFHTQCAGLANEPEGSFLCFECLSGRPILYGDIVWVKMSIYRWWPGRVFPLDEIPLQHQKHQPSAGEFLVYFYGSNNSAYVYRGQVFHYQDGDQGCKSKSKNKLADDFKQALEIVTPAFQARQAVLAQRKAERRSKLCLKPPLYNKIKSNKAVGKVRIYDASSKNASRCECDGNNEQVAPCGPDSECINRMLLFECDPSVCPGKGRCQNQRFQKRLSPPLYPFNADGKGWGLKSKTDIKKGEFVVEYVGEVIDNNEFRRRLKEKQDAGDEAYYFLTLDNNRMIDAGPSGNLARFMNHSCQPNCETQKWTVLGDTRVGLFACTDIPAETELTFNYQLECAQDVANEAKRQQPCHCGAPNCGGFIGAKPKQSEAEKLLKAGKAKKDKKKKRQRKPAEKEKVADDVCFRCTEGGCLVLCDLRNCSKVYHVECLNLSAPPKGQWTCPWHHCDVCGRKAIQFCQICPNSLCPTHAVEVDMQSHEILGSVCNEHSQEEIEFYVKRQSEMAQLVPSPEPSSSLSETSSS